MLNASGENLGRVGIRRGIFQGNSLSPLLFVVCMVSWTWLLKLIKADYENKNQVKNANFVLIKLALADLALTKSTFSHLAPIK